MTSPPPSPYAPWKVLSNLSISGPLPSQVLGISSFRFLLVSDRIELPEEKDALPVTLFPPFASWTV